MTLDNCFSRFQKTYVKINDEVRKNSTTTQTQRVWPWAKSAVSVLFFFCVFLSPEDVAGVVVEDFLAQQGGVDVGIDFCGTDVFVS